MNKPKMFWHKDAPLKAKVLLWWTRLWVRKYEFHWTLETDNRICSHLTREGLKWYCIDLTRRRRLARNAK